MQTRLKGLTLLLTSILLVTLVTATLATGTASTQRSGGKQVVLDTQVISATDVLTGTFRIPEAAAQESAFDFARFRLFFMGILAFLAVNYALLIGNKRFAAAISATLAFGVAVVCTVYFDSFHGYYWESVAARFQGISKTIHVAFGWLSDTLFWLLFVGLLLLSWIPVWVSYRKNRSAKRTAADLIDH